MRGITAPACFDLPEEIQPRCLDRRADRSCEANAVIRAAVSVLASGEIFSVAKALAEPAARSLMRAQPGGGERLLRLGGEQP